MFSATVISGNKARFWKISAVGRRLGPMPRMSLPPILTAPSDGSRKPETVRRIVDEHVTGTRSHGDRLWLLVNLEMWLRMAVDGEEPESFEERTERMAVSA